MSDLDDLKKSIHEMGAKRKEAQKHAKLQLENVERLDFCAFMALEHNEYGRELMDAFKKVLISGSRYNDPDLSHTTGFEDFIRFMIRMVDSHKYRESLKVKE